MDFISPLVAFVIQTSQIKIEKGQSAYQQAQELQVKELFRGGSFTGNGEVKVIGESFEQCVIYARRITGNSKISGYAGNLRPEGHEPKIGAVALERGHVSVVMALSGDYIILHDANYRRGKITERKVSRNSIRGYIY